MKKDSFVESTEEGKQPLGSFPNNKVTLIKTPGYEKALYFQDHSVIEHTTYDAEPYVKAAKEAQAVGPKEFTLPGGEKFVRAAVIPEAEMGRMIAEGWINDDKAVQKWFAERPDLVHDRRYIK